MALSDDQIKSRLADLAKDRSSQHNEAMAVKFNGPQPHAKILNQWRHLHFPAKAMQIFNGAGLGRMEALQIYYDRSGTPRPAELLLHLGKVMAAGKDDSKTDWKECALAKNLILDTNGRDWWENVVSSMLSTLRQAVEQDGKATVLHHSHPNLIKITPKDERTLLYAKIENECPALQHLYGTEVYPHHRILDKLEQEQRCGRPVPNLEVKAMWTQQDEIKTKSHTNNHAFSPEMSALLFAMGTDRVEKEICIASWGDFHSRMVSFSLALGLTGECELEAACFTMGKYLKILRKEFLTTQHQ